MSTQAFEYRQAQEIQRVFAAHGVRYLFLGTGAILLGYPDTTQAADLYVDKRRENCNAVVHFAGARGGPALVWNKGSPESPRRFAARHFGIRSPPPGGLPIGRSASAGVLFPNLRRRSLYGRNSQKEVVTTKVCFENEAGKMVCQQQKK